MDGDIGVFGDLSRTKGTDHTIIPKRSTGRTKDMADDQIELSQELMRKFFEDVKAPYRYKEDEVRRSINVSSGFYEKLATLNAGSIAILSSAILAIAAKQESSGAYRTVIHDLIIVAVLLWMSLMCSLIHNFVATLIAGYDARIADQEFTEQLMQMSFELNHKSLPGLTDETFAQAQELVRRQVAKEHSRAIKKRSYLYPAVKVLGYVSWLLFLSAYSLVLFFLRGLW